MKRHSAEEISAKLHEAAAHKASGLSQAQTCKKLGVSVMTFHRWRKFQLVHVALSTSSTAGGVAIAARCFKGDAANDVRIAELRLENDRLRRIATDLLLEKMRKTDDFQARERRSN